MDNRHALVSEQAIDRVAIQNSIFSHVGRELLKCHVPLALDSRALAELVQELLNWNLLGNAQEVFHELHIDEIMLLI